MKKGILTKFLESAALEKIYTLLGRVPNIKIDSFVREPKPRARFHTGGQIDFSHAGVQYSVLIEVKSNGAPRTVEYAVYQLKRYLELLHRLDAGSSARRLIPMLVSPYLSPQARTICDEHNVAYLDLVGNARLAFADVYIDLAVPDVPKTEVRSLRSLFSAKAGAVLRAMLREPKRSWRVAELAKSANSSLGHVSNVRKELLRRDWIEVRKRGIVLVKPDALLESWRENFKQPVRQTVSGYTHLHGELLDETLSNVLNPNSNRPCAIYSMHSAARWLAPYARGGTVTFYADQAGASLLRSTMELTPAKGANVRIGIVSDMTLFKDAVEASPGIFCSDPVSTYLDLWNGNDRDREAAEFLAGEYFKWL